MHWSAAYVGQPWQDLGRGPNAFDCYGLLAEVYRGVLGIELASYAGVYTSANERAEISALLSDAAAAWPWHPIDAGKERELDAVLFRRGGVANHVGIAVGDGRMLHVVSGALSCIESYRAGRWWPRLVGFYRHATCL
jgi:cell wall-associated NlpC family hydrolase